MEHVMGMRHGMDMQTCLQLAIDMPHAMMPSPDARDQRPWSLNVLQNAPESVDEPENEAQGCESVNVNEGVNVNLNYPSESVNENDANQGGLEHSAHVGQAPPSSGMQGISLSAEPP